MIIAPPPLYILAGGQSSRFGSDKARAVVDGTPMIVAVANALSSVTSRITVVAGAPDVYADVGLRTVADHVPGQGPLGGLATAITDLLTDEDWLLLASCDLVRPSASWASDLMQTAVPPAVAFRGKSWEPLLALYHRSVHAAVQTRLAAGRRSMHGLLDEIGAQARPLPDGLDALPQANTVEELRRGARSGSGF